MTSLGLVVRKVKQQGIFSYYWVKDAIDASIKESAERKLLLFEDSLRRSTLPSIDLSNNTSCTSGSASIIYDGRAGTSFTNNGVVEASGFTLSGLQRTAGIDAAAGFTKDKAKMTALPDISEGQEQGQEQEQGHERRRRFGISEIQEQLFKKGNVTRKPSVTRAQEMNQELESEKDLTSRRSSDSGTYSSDLRTTYYIDLF